MRWLLLCTAPLRCLVFYAGCLAGCFPMEFCSNAPASNSSVTAPLPATALSGCPLPAASCSVASPGQQQLSHHGAPASSSSVTVSTASSIFPMALRCSAPASNKPHPAEKSTPVWLAIWCTWAGFANSQLLPDAAAVSSMQGLPRSGNSSAQTSASLQPPAALRLRCLPFTGHGRPRSVRKSSRLHWKCLSMD